MTIPSQDAATTTILVVDDYEDGRQVVDDVLSHRGYVVHQACSGTEALQLAEELMPDLMILDLALPGVDGWEVARRLKGGKRTAGIVILALTAHAEEVLLQRARTVGCDAVLTKPCMPGELVEEVGRLLLHRPITGCEAGA